MNEITIKIKQLGPLRDVELGMKPMTILTGESSLGKSYANYLLYYLCKMLGSSSRLMPDTFTADKEDEEMDVVIPRATIEERLHEEAEPFMRQLLGDPEMTCDVAFEFRGLPDQLRYQYTITRQEARQQGEGGQVRIRSLDYIISATINGEHSTTVYANYKKGLPYSVFASCLRTAVMGHPSIDTIILPPGRGALVGESYTTKGRTGEAMGLYHDFLTQYDQYACNEKGFVKAKTFRDMASELIGGRLESVKDRQYLTLPSGQKLPLSAAASSVKEISPFLFCVMNRTRPASLCFDEPEAHLHPEMQTRVANLIAACRNSGYLFQITTHSDYFLSRINQLIKLGAIREKDKDKAALLADRLGIPRAALLRKEDIGAYYFERQADGAITVKKLETTDHGIPFATFYDTITRDREIDEEINATYDSLQTTERND